MFPKVNWHGFLTPPPQDDQLPVDEAIELINKIIELKNQGADNEEIIKGLVLLVLLRKLCFSEPVGCL